MSTVDPAEARRRRNGDGPGRERLARRAVGCYLAGAVASVILGVGVALLFDTLRSSTIMPIDDELLARADDRGDMRTTLTLRIQDYIPEIDCPGNAYGQLAHIRYTDILIQRPGVFTTGRDVTRLAAEH